jgi:hypothetical protein
MKSSIRAQILALAAIIIHIGSIFNPLLAQNYTEVNVFGWGMATNEAAPTLADIDNDGYIDMLVGEASGKIWHLEQTSGDEFAVISRNFSDIDVQSQAIPKLTDLDHDGLLDLIVGSNSEIAWFEQESVNSYRFIFIDDDLESTDVGAHLAPALADIDNDGYIDMLVGESLGNLNHFVQDTLNTGSFLLVEQVWMDWYGSIFVFPTFTDLENDGKLDLIIGNGNGILYHFAQDSIFSTSFTEMSNNFAGIDVGFSAKPALFDIDQDAKLDLFVGEWYKGLFHYEQVDSGSTDFILLNEEVLGVRDFGAKAGYTIEDIDGDGLLDMLVAEYFAESESYLIHYEQHEAGSLLFDRIDDSFNDIEVSQYYRLTIYDINGNDLMDLFVSDVFGETVRYEQESVNSYTFLLKDELFNDPMRVNQNAQLAFADFDGDSLLDMLVGEGSGTTYHYEQDSINATTFTQITNRFLNLDVGWISSPVFTDVDEDELLDLIIGNLSGTLRYYEQETTDSENFVLISDDFGSASVNNDATPRFADVNLDGRIDLFLGDYSGGIKLYLRGKDDDVSPPDIPRDLAATVVNEVAELSWTAVAAEDLMLYNIYRSTRNDTAVSEYINSVSALETTYYDSSLTISGTYYYWISALDSVGNESGFSEVDSIDIIISALESDLNVTANKFALYQNYPNPFNPTTKINYELPITNYVDLSIYNTLGQKVKVLVSERQAAGRYVVEWDASGMASGVYYYVINTSEFQDVKKMILIR